MRAERGGDTGPQSRYGGRGLGDVPLDVVAAAEQQRHENGPVGAVLGVEGGEGVGQQRFVQLDVAEVHGQVRAQLADTLDQGAYGAQRARVAAAVRDEDERRRRGAAGPVQRHEAELTAELAGDRVHELRRTVEVGATERLPADGGPPARAKPRVGEGPGLVVRGFDAVMDRW